MTEVIGVDGEEESLSAEDQNIPVIASFGADNESPAVAVREPRCQDMGYPDSSWCVVVHRQTASDRHFADNVGYEATEVVQNGRDSTSVRDSRRAAMAEIECVSGAEETAVTGDLQAMPM